MEEFSEYRVSLRPWAPHDHGRFVEGGHDALVLDWDKESVGDLGFLRTLPGLRAVHLDGPPRRRG
ncbi:hypothetical protein [Alloactinosynnema sp. L-07]|uniref:hypothetical protein n=1 Tax=Alloactinosynnema sp. L-07 TaxID=1653480 RepID=UPI0006B6428C|nr:hypothetical protein [Alloactinosynnema sp. L-07]